MKWNAITEDEILKMSIVRRETGMAIDDMVFELLSEDISCLTCRFNNHQHCDGNKQGWCGSWSKKECAE
jgi:hypothetical protein